MQSCRYLGGDLRASHCITTTRQDVVCDFMTGLPLNVESGDLWLHAARNVQVGFRAKELDQGPATARKSRPLFGEDPALKEHAER